MHTAPLVPPGPFVMKGRGMHTAPLVPPGPFVIKGGECTPHPWFPQAPRGGLGGTAGGSLRPLFYLVRVTLG